MEIFKNTELNKEYILEYYNMLNYKGFSMTLETKYIRKNTDTKSINNAKDAVSKMDDYIKTQSSFFNLLGNKVRLSIVYLLTNFDKLCVHDISDILCISQSSISQHLRKLKDGNIIQNQRDGSIIYYFLDTDVKAKIEINFKG